MMLAALSERMPSTLCSWCIKAFSVVYRCAGLCCGDILSLLTSGQLSLLRCGAWTRLEMQRATGSASAILGAHRSADNQGRS